MTTTPSLTKGALAGLIGTAAMTAAQIVEMRLTGREPSLVPGRVASKLLGLEPKDDAALSRISITMHWAHGITMARSGRCSPERACAALAARPRTSP